MSRGTPGRWEGHPPARRRAMAAPRRHRRPGGGHRQTVLVRPRRPASRAGLTHRSAATCAAHVGPSATVRDGGRSAASAGRSRHREHPGARVSMAETLIGGAWQQPQFAESDVRHSRRRTCNTPPAAPRGCWPRCRTRSMPASTSLPPERGLPWPARPAGTNPPPGARHYSNARISPLSGGTSTVTTSPRPPALRGMPAARARHRRQLLRPRRRPPDHRAATRTRRPTRAASAGLAALPRLATPPPGRHAPATRDSRQQQVTVCHDAQDPAPILVTSRLRAVLRLRHAGLRTAGLQPASRYRRGARTVTLIQVPECPLSL
jgi:hypothetical protein